MIMFWAALLAISILLYVLLDGFDLGVGMLFGLARGEAERRAMLSAVAPVWDGNETWLVVTGVILWGAFPPVYATLLSAFYLPLIVMLARLDPARGGVRVPRTRRERMRWIWDVGFAGGSLVADLHAGHDGRRPGRGPADHATASMSAAISAGSAPFAVLCGARPLPRLRPARRRLAGRENARARSATRPAGRYPWLAIGVLVFLVVVFVYALAEDLRDHASVARSAVSLRLPGDRRRSRRPCLPSACFAADD